MFTFLVGAGEYANAVAGVRVGKTDYSLQQWKALNSPLEPVLAQLVGFFGKERVAQALQVSTGAVTQRLKGVKLNLSESKALTHLESKLRNEREVVKSIFKEWLLQFSPKMRSGKIERAIVNLERENLPFALVSQMKDLINESA